MELYEKLKLNVSDKKLASSSADKTYNEKVFVLEFPLSA